jgi:hypothetical protein
MKIGLLPILGREDILPHVLIPHLHACQQALHRQGCINLLQSESVVVPQHGRPRYQSAGFGADFDTRGVGRRHESHCARLGFNQSGRDVLPRPSHHKRTCQISPEDICA